MSPRHGARGPKGRRCSERAVVAARRPGRPPDVPQGAGERRSRGRGRRLLAGAARADHPVRGAPRRRRPRRRHLVRQRLRGVPGRLRRPRSHAGGSGGQGRGQSRAPRQPGRALRPRPGLAAGALQPRSHHRSPPPSRHRRRGGAERARAGGLGRGAAGTRRPAAGPLRGRPGRPRRADHPAVDRHARRAGLEVVGRPRRAVGPLRAVRLRGDPRRQRAGLRAPGGAPLRLRPGRDGGLVRGRLPGDVRLARRVRPRPRGGSAGSGTAAPRGSCRSSPASR